MATIVVSDIDGTISDGGNPIGPVVEHLQATAAAGYSVFIVSARNESDLEATRNWLDENDVPHASIRLSPGGDATAFKVGVARELLSRYEISEWIENNPQTRSALSDLGINTVGPSRFRALEDGMETRTTPVTDIEFRESGDGMSFSGYAAVFNSPSEPLPFREVIAPGAFSRSLKSRNNVFLLWSHDTSMPLASTRSKTLRLAEDAKGLVVDATLPNTSQGRDAAELLRAGVVDSMSFGFSVPPGGDSWSEDGGQRELRQVRLHEVSVVAFPAYTKTSASVRSIDTLADKTGADAEALNSALDALERGETLTVDQADLLSNVVASLSPVSEPAEPATNDEAKANLDLLRKQLDLHFKSL